jgi:hypothetical protein
MNESTLVQRADATVVDRFVKTGREKELNRGWSPYLAGGLAGLLLVASTLVAGKYIGASTTYARSVGMIESLFSPDRVRTMEYFIRERPIVDWQWVFVIGIILGALASAIQSKTFKWKALPDSWEARFGPSRTKRAAAALVGGTVAMFGARLADG